MLRFPILYKHYDRSSLELDNIYMAMQNEDLSLSVVTALKLLEKNNNFFPFPNKLKSTSKSLEYGIVGKIAFSEGDYGMALLNYNKALMQAPKNSDAMRSAYFNRTELLFKTRQYISCIKDIETCLSLGCPDNMGYKLKGMKEEALKYVQVETAFQEQMHSSFTESFFKLKGEHNSDIPFVSSDIEIFMESQQPKVIATRDIPVGTVLAVERSFVNEPHFFNHINTCHYCLKMSFNLMPCDGCCNVLFCDNHCKEQSMQEDHNVACKIIQCLMFEDISCTLAVKAVLKMRQMCKSWEELIAASHDLGVDRLKHSSIADIFGYNKFSLLTTHNDKHFIYGTIFNNCMYFANIIHYLDTKTSFLPNSPEDKSAAICAISRIMMHLSLYSSPVLIRHSTLEVNTGVTQMLDQTNNGYFSFIGKLSHSCQPNSYAVGIRNKVALVTFVPIKQGTELTFPYLNNWLEADEEENKIRATKIFFNYKTFCNCIICNSDMILNKQLLNDNQKKAYKAFCLDKKLKNYTQEIQLAYIKTCKTLELLADAPYSKEYREAFVLFVKCLIFCLCCQSPNVIMANKDFYKAMRLF